MQKFYFTYGTDPAYPFQGGWTLIVAPDEKTAVQIFRVFHPDRFGSGCLNCADYYRGERFEKSKMYKDGNFGAYCREVIKVLHALAEATEGGQA